MAPTSLSLLAAGCIVSVALAGCGGSPGSGSASAKGSGAQGLSCSSPLPGTPLEQVVEPPPKSPAGPMSDALAAAKRDFDHEKWEQAIKGLDAVQSGSDDEGNKQHAEYWRAISLYRVKRMAEAGTAFVRIAQRPSHVKFADTTLWIGKLIEQDASMVRAARLYPDEAIEKLNNQNQREMYFALAFFFGRERFERKEWASASALLGHVDPSSPYHARAQECLAAAKANGR